MNRRANRPMLHASGLRVCGGRLSQTGETERGGGHYDENPHSALLVLHRLTLGRGPAASPQGDLRCQIHRMNKVNAVAATTT